jgi:di/tricarboxylate transporter
LEHFDLNKLGSIYSGMLPFSLALRTGRVDLAADAVVGFVGGAAPRLVLATLFVITAALGLFISNAAVALAIAKELGASPYPLAMIVALASAAFMTPISSPVNTLESRCLALFRDPDP